MALTNATNEVTPDLLRQRILFVNLYLWGTPESWVLIDAGLPKSAGTIVETAEERFGKGATPQAIVLTHGHFDHVGAFPELFEHWDVPVYAYPLELPHLTGQTDYPEPDPTVGEGVMALLSFAYPNKAIDLGAASTRCRRTRACRSCPVGAGSTSPVIPSARSPSSEKATVA